MAFEIVEPLSKDYRKYVIPLRREIFLPQGFTQEDDLMILNPLDGLSYHLLHLNERGKPIGTISIVDTLGSEEEIIKSRGLRDDLGRVAMVGKFAVPKGLRHQLIGFKLANAALNTINEFDYAFAELAPPMRQPNNLTHTEKLVKNYSHLFGFEVIGSYNYRGTLPHVLIGKKLRD